MSAGRPPKPRAQRVLEGNPGKRPLPANVGGQVVRPAPPRRLHGRRVRDAWRELVEPLADADLLTALDVQALEILAVNLAAFREAADDIARKGLIVYEETKASKEAREKNPDLEPIVYPAYNPHLGMMNKFATQAQRLLSEFGMTPSSRAKVTPVDSPEGESAFEKLAREARERRAARTKEK